MGPGFLQGDMSGKQLVHWHSPPWNCRLIISTSLEDPWLTKSSQNDQNSGGDQTSVNVHLESLLELAPSYGE